MSIISDEYFHQQMEDLQEHKTVGECLNCRTKLYSGEEIITDYHDDYFCDFECANSFHEINEVDIDVISYDKGYTCDCCESVLNENTFEVYTNKWDEYFCSVECAEQSVGLEYIIL